jgi:hypothetical protein
MVMDLESVTLPSYLMALPHFSELSWTMPHTEIMRSLKVRSVRREVRRGPGEVWLVMSW